jgi:two-component system chemotaxis sensor kinase CheA
VLELQDRQAVHFTWMKLCMSIEVLLGTSDAGRIEIDDSEYEALLRAVLRAESPESLAQRIRAWKLEPSARRLNRVAEQAQDIARRLQKGALSVRVEDHALHLDPRAWASFWSAFVHVIRNAVDHGIESPEERLASGKPAAGNLALVTRLEHGEFVIQVEDDGRGIDWQSVARRAQRFGLPFQTEEDLVEALFADGVSTRDDVNEHSGRGIGMGVVREACRARSGRIQVSSQSGRGTRMEFRFPRAAVGEIQLARAS